MARPRTFELEDAVNDAMQVFWEKGYVGASLPDLLKGTGLTRGSLYKAFHDKKALFLKALETYDRSQVDAAVDHLSKSPGPGEGDRIETLFMSIVETVKSGDRRGCLLCSAAAGAANEDQDIAIAVEAMLARMTKAFATALSNRPSRPTRQDDMDLQAAALTAGYVGMRTLVRSGASIDLLDKAAHAIVRNTQ